MFFVFPVSDLSFCAALREVHEHESRCVLSDIAPFVLPLTEENRRLSALVETLASRVDELEKRLSTGSSSSAASSLKRSDGALTMTPSSSTSPGPHSPVVSVKNGSGGGGGGGSGGGGSRWADSSIPKEVLSPGTNGGSGSHGSNGATPNGTAKPKKASLGGGGNGGSAKLNGSANGIKLNGSNGHLNLSAVQSPANGAVGANGANGAAGYYTSVYVGNINFSATKHDVADRFQEFGTIDSVKMLKDEVRRIACVCGVC